MRRICIGLLLVASTTAGCASPESESPGFLGNYGGLPWKSLMKKNADQNNEDSFVVPKFNGSGRFAQQTTPTVGSVTPNEAAVDQARPVRLRPKEIRPRNDLRPSEPRPGISEPRPEIKDRHMRALAWASCSCLSRQRAAPIWMPAASWRITTACPCRGCSRKPRPKAAPTRRFRICNTPRRDVLRGSRELRPTRRRASRRSGKPRRYKPRPGKHQPRNLRPRKLRRSDLAGPQTVGDRSPLPPPADSRSWLASVSTVRCW